MKMSFWTFIMWQVETSKSLKAVVKKHSKKFHSLCKHGRQSYLQPDKLVKFKKKIVLTKDLSYIVCRTYYGVAMFCLTEAGKQQIDWVPNRTEQHWKGMPKIDCEDAKNMADKSTKITIFFVWEAL